MPAERVKRIVANFLGIEEADVKPETTLAELGLDSLDVIELTLYVEDEFAIVISDADADGFKCVQDIVNHVAKAQVP